VFRVLFVTFDPSDPAPLDLLLSRSASSIALNDKNGSFISTLRMELYDVRG